MSVSSNVVVAEGDRGSCPTRLNFGLSKNCQKCSACWKIFVQKCKFDLEDSLFSGNLNAQKIKLLEPRYSV